METTRLFATGGLLALTITTLCGCSFSAPPNGSLRCATKARLCPDGYTCSDLTNTCWKKGPLSDASGIETGDAFSRIDGQVAHEAGDSARDILRSEVQSAPKSPDASPDPSADAPADAPPDLLPGPDAPPAPDASLPDVKPDQAVAGKPVVVDGPCPDGGCCYTGAACDRGQVCKLGQISCTAGASVCLESGNAPDGTTCGSGKVCSAGGCVACSAGASCVPPNPCHKGTLSCAGGTPTCTDAVTSLDEGASCGANKVCYLGTCTDCTVGAACDIANSPCHLGQTTCNTGQPVCVDNGAAPNGKACGSGLVCSAGECMACSAGTACVPANPCHVGTQDCSAGTPACTDTGTAIKDGTTCGTNLFCSAGACLACTENVDCVPTGTTCKDGKTSCTTGKSVCTQTGNASDGSNCGNNQVCSAGACVACAGGSACTPTASPCHNGSLNCSAGTPACTDLATNQANGTSCGSDRVCSSGTCVTCTAGTACTPNNDVCKTGQTTCATGASVCGATGNVPDSSAIPCAPGKICVGGSCSIIPGCPTDGSAALGCPCATSGSTKCSTTTARPNKLPLICTAGVWVQHGVACDSTQNCDWATGACAAILAPCVGQTPGFSYCDYSPGVTIYKDVRKICGPDLVTTTSITCSGVCNNNLGCQDVRCGDGKIESGEECDDGNAVALDGCEPASAPGAVCARSKILAVSAGGTHTCGLFKGGYVRCWGLNDANQLGLGHTQFEGNNKPYQLTVFDSGGNPKPAAPVDFGGIAVTAISTGTDFTCALLTDQTVRCWGKNDSGQLGLGNTTAYPTATPNSLGAINLGGAAKAIGAAGTTACALLTNGNVRCWGINGGMLGTGDITTLNLSTPAQIAAMPAYPNWISLGSTATTLSVGSGSICALLSDNNVRCWGSNGSGQLGTGATTQFSRTLVPSAYSAVLFPASKTPTSISVGGGHACARLNDGTAECWGNNAAGQLGVGTTANVGGFNSPVTNGQVAIPAAGVDRIFAGLGSNTCAYVSSGGGVRCWGDNSKGQLGYADLNPRGNTPQNTPNVAAQCPAINFGGGLTAASLSMGATHACAILSNGELRCWGNNFNGQLGLGFTSPSPTDYVGGSSSTTPNNAVTSVQLFP